MHTLSSLAQHFGFHIEAFTLPPLVAVDSDEHIALWRAWLSKMEHEFAVEHESKPAYPDFTQSPYKEILSGGRKELELLLDAHDRAFPSIIGGKAWGGDRGQSVASHYPLEGNDFAYSWGRSTGGKADAQLHEALVSSLTASRGEWGSHEHWPDRVRMLMHASRLALLRTPIFLAAMVTEVGMSPREAWGEYDEVIDFIRGYAIEATKVYLDEWFRPPKWKGEIHGHRASSQGVILSVAPFNFPAAIGVSMTFSALVMGNAVVHCPSEKTIVTGWLDYMLARDAIELTSKAYKHQDIIHYAVSHRGDTVRALLSHPEVAGLSFTGSSAVFETLVRDYGSLKRWNGSTSLVIAAAETSGVNPVYVAEDADVSKAAKELPGSFLGRSGHKCSSSRFIMVHAKVYDRFKQEFLAAIDGLSYGNVFEGAYFGPVVSQEISEEILGKVMRVVNDGDAFLLYQKPIVGTGGFDMGAMVLEATGHARNDKTRLTRLRNTEIFGPVTCLMCVTSLDEAIRTASMSDFALTASIYTGSEETAAAWSMNVRAGNSNVNMPPTGALAVSQWFGGPPSRSGGNWGAKGSDLVRRLRSEKALSIKMPASLDEEGKKAWIAKYRQVMTFSRKVD